MYVFNDSEALSEEYEAAPILGQHERLTLYQHQQRGRCVT